MPTVPLDLDALLQPIAGEQPAGADLRFAPEWKKLEEAKRADDNLDKGSWEPKEQKVADWRLVRELSSELLATKSKDIRLAVLLTEALVREHGFDGAAAGVALLRELTARYWDSGLYPAVDGDNLEDRAAAFDWINTNLPELARDVDLTARTDGGADYTFARYLDARDVGRDRDNEEGRVSSERRERFLKARAEGRCLDLYDAAMTATPLEPVESHLKGLDALLSEVTSLGSLLNEKFGNSEHAPGFSQAREALSEIHGLLDTAARIKRPATGSSSPGGQTATPNLTFGGGVWGGGGDATAGAWADAEKKVRDGQIEDGLREMAQLAQQETSGRARYRRKLLLADVCLQIKRERLAQKVLEELNEQIDKYKLDEWETTDVVGAVWSRLYRVYRRANEADKAEQLYHRLCRLDPWQTLGFGED